ncbi:MAG: hypothetical protein R3A52_11790 [Polyangiales bacterium]
MDRPRNDRSDRDLRELLLYLRDSFHDAAGRIDDYLARMDDGRAPRRDDRDPRAPRRDDRDPRDVRRDDREPRRQWDAPRAAPAADPYVHEGLEKLREEVRWISGEAANMEPALLRLFIEAVTAETRVLQSRATDPDDSDIAAKIMRALTAIVSDYRPGHVYGLARHHQADWSDIARRARGEIRERQGDGGERASTPAPAEDDAN